jgi:hypothetical protein
VLLLKITSTTKIEGYNIDAAMVDTQKRFLDVYVRLLWSVNGSRVLRKSRLYHYALHGGFFDMATGSQDGLPPYLFENKGYPLLSWLMTPHKEDGEHHSIL